jgi:multiple sugar transport system ATP-binding protein
MNLFHGTLEGAGDRLEFVEREPAGGGLRLALPAAMAARGAKHQGRPVVLGLRPEHVREAALRSGADVLAEVRVELLEPMGAEAFLHVTTGATALIARVAPASRFEPGQRVQLAFALERAHLFDAETGRVLG